MVSNKIDPYVVAHLDRLSNKELLKLLRPNLEGLTNKELLEMREKLEGLSNEELLDIIDINLSKLSNKELIEIICEKMNEKQISNMIIRKLDRPHISFSNNPLLRNRKIVPRSRRNQGTIKSILPSISYRAQTNKIFRTKSRLRPEKGRINGNNYFKMMKRYEN